MRPLYVYLAVFVYPHDEAGVMTGDHKVGGDCRCMLFF